MGSPVSAAVNAAPYAHDIQVNPQEVSFAIRKLADMGLAAKSHGIIRPVDQDEENAQLAEFSRRNLMPKTEINLELVYHWALALPRRASELTRIQ